MIDYLYDMGLFPRSVRLATRRLVRGGVLNFELSYISTRWITSRIVTSTMSYFGWYTQDLTIKIEFKVPQFYMKTSQRA